MVESGNNEVVRLNLTQLLITCFRRKRVGGSDVLYYNMLLFRVYYTALLIFFKCYHNIIKLLYCYYARTLVNHQVSQTLSCLECQGRSFIRKTINTTRRPDGCLHNLCKPNEQSSQSAMQFKLLILPSHANLHPTES